MAVKKLYLLYILEILRKYSDRDHTLTHAEIIARMKQDYGIECERKAVARNLGDLQDLGYEIGYDKGYYLITRDFDDSELRLLIDSVLCSKYIPGRQAASLIERLAGLSSVYFRKQIRHVSNLERMDRKPNQVFYSIDMLSEAIEAGKKVRFYYGRYNEKGRLVRTSTDKYLVNPYQIAAANGRYYLIGNVDKYDNSAHFRVEKIIDVEMSDEAVKPVTEVTEFRNGLDLPRHMAEHIYMFSGNSELITLRVAEDGINDAYDWLGHDIYVRREDEDNFLVEVRANPFAIKYWAIQFGAVMEIMSPAWLREETGALAGEIYNKYRQE